MRNLLPLARVLSGRARGGRARLAGATAGIAIGTVLLLLVLAAYQGVQLRAERQMQFGSGVNAVPIDEMLEDDPGYVDRLAAGDELPDSAIAVLDRGVRASDVFRGAQIRRVDVAAGAHSTVPIPGLDAAPAPGEYAASPALAALVDRTPDAELGERYGQRVATIGTEGLGSPDDLVVIVGHDPAALAAMPGAMLVEGFAGEAFPSPAYAVLATVGALAVLFPVAVLIGIVTRLGQSAREDRIALLGMMGATPVRLAALAAVEAAATALGGAALGTGIAVVGRPLAAEIRIEEGRFFASDLVLPLAVLVGVAAVIVATAVLAAFVSALRVRLIAMGSGRGRPERRPGLVRLLPLVLGLGILGAIALGTRLRPVGSESAGPLFAVLILAVPAAFLLVLGGLVLAGPLILSRVSALGSRRARSAEGVLACNRLARHPASTFRSVSGLVVALFVVTFFAVTITAGAEEAAAGGSVLGGPDRLAGSSLVAVIAGSPVTEAGSASEAEGGSASEADGAMAAARERAVRIAASLGELPGVRHAFPVFGSDAVEGRALIRGEDAARAGLEVPAGAERVSLNFDYFSTFPETPGPVEVAALPGGEAALGDPMLMVVETYGDPGSIERARTAIIGAPEAAAPTGESPMTLAEQAAGAGAGLSWARQYTGLANAGILIAAAISAIALAVATIAGVLDRRRPLALLRLTGMPVERLRRSLVIEAVVPVASVLALCLGAGAFTSWAVVTGISPTRSVSWPAPDYWIAVAACAGIAALAVLATLPTASRATAVTATRFE